MLALAATLYAIALVTLDKPPSGDILELRWATDANPARIKQTSLFGDMFPGLEVAVDPGLGGDQTKLIVQCATGTGPDIIDVYDQEAMSSLVDAGILMDLTPYAEERGFGVDNTYPALRDALMIEGKQYRFPCNVWANCMVYNKAVFDDRGVPYPTGDWTWTEFLEVCRQLRDSPSASGEDHFAFANWNKINWFGELYVNKGGRYFSEDGLTCLLDSPEALWAIQFYHDAIYEHEVVPSAAQLASLSSQGGWGSGWLSIFSNGKVAMLIIGRWYLCQVEYFPDMKGNLGACLLPHVEGREPTGLCDTRAAGINAMGANKEEALHFLEYLASPQYSELIVQDGDSMPPNPALAQSGEMLVNDAEPDPAFHQPFVEAMENAQPADLSPFMDALVMRRWLGEAIDRVEEQVEPPDVAFKALTAEINRTIRKNLERQPYLQEVYEERTGRPYTEDWWREHQGS
jgi:multiple sugar transport system substrate-binding protein